jgi:hypothetical protein
MVSTGVVEQTGFGWRRLLVLVGLGFAGLLGLVIVDGLIYSFGISGAMIVVAGAVLTWAWLRDRKAVEQARRDYEE